MSRIPLNLDLGGSYDVKGFKTIDHMESTERSDRYQSRMSP